MQRLPSGKFSFGFSAESTNLFYTYPVPISEHRTVRVHYVAEFRDLAALMLGIILDRFCVTLPAFVTTVLACTENDHFPSSYSPRYLKLLHVVTWCPPMVMRMSLCVLVREIIIASHF